MSLNFDILNKMNTGLSATAYEIWIAFARETIISSLKISYFVYDNVLVPWIARSSPAMFSSGVNNLFELPGPRSFSANYAFSMNSRVIVLFVSAVDLIRTDSTDPLYFRAELSQLNATHSQISYFKDGNTKLYYMKSVTI